MVDIACDCEDGAAIGSERAHAAVMAGLIGSDGNRFSRVGARVHDVHHPAWQGEVDVLLDGAGDRIAQLVIQRVEHAAFDAVLLARAVPGRPVHVRWRRADELSWSPFGSAMAVELGV